MPENDPPSQSTPPPLPPAKGTRPDAVVPPAPQPVPPGASAPVPPDKAKTVPLPSVSKVGSVTKVDMLDKTPAPLLSRSRRKTGTEEAPVSGKTESSTVAPPSAAPPPTPPPAETKAAASPSPLPAEKAEENALKNKLPLPLLSRRRSSRPAHPARLDIASADSSRPARRGIPLWAHVLLRVLLVAVIIGAGYGFYYQFRQTRLEVFIVVPADFQLEGEAMLVRNFASDMLAVRDDMTLAEDPVKDRVRDRTEALSRVRADVAGHEERKRILEKEAGELRQEAEKILEESRNRAQKVWDDEDSRLDAEYNSRLGALKGAIESRAKALGLKYENNEEISSPEVWVNAYRLGLYDAPKTVKGGEEREWAEKQLSEWRIFEADWNKRMGQVQDKVQQLKNEAGSKIEQIQNRLQDLDSRVQETDAELEPLHKEAGDTARQVEDTTAEAAAVEAPYYDQLLQVPVKNVDIRLPVKGSGRISWQHIDRDDAHPPGSYYLWIRGRKNGDECWALVPFQLYPYAESRVTVYDPAFLSVREFLHRRD